MRHNLRISAIWALVWVLLALAACGMQPETLPAPAAEMLVGTPVGIISQETLAALQTQEKSSADAQAAATAEIMRINAQATLNSASATLSAALIQEQNIANAIAAQIAATAEIARANAQATLVAAGSTQSAALTQDAIRQTQVVDQQNKEELAASTQTAIANQIATQTQAAAATSQWYSDQALQREEQRQGPITFLWMWCLPIFLVLLAGLVVWGFWRWLKIRQTNQQVLENPVDKLPSPAAEVVHHQQDDLLPYLESDDVDRRYRLTKPDDQVRRWLDEVKRKLLSSDDKDEDGNPED